MNEQVIDFLTSDIAGSVDRPMWCPVYKVRLDLTQCSDMVSDWLCLQEGYLTKHDSSFSGTRCEMCFIALKGRVLEYYGPVRFPLF